MTAHVNDGGFWLVKEYFGLSIKDTLKTWTVSAEMFMIDQQPADQSAF